MHRPSYTKIMVATIVAAAFASQAWAQSATKPPVSVVLAHGAFENSSIWDKVIPIPQRWGIRVVTAQNPLTAVNADAQTPPGSSMTSPATSFLLATPTGVLSSLKPGTIPR